MPQQSLNQRTRNGVLLGLGLLAAACAVDPQATVPVCAPGVEVDRKTFATEAGPLLEKRCGDAMCHGRPERPLALYAVGAYRQDPAKTHVKVPLTEAELDANYTSVLGFLDSTNPRATTLLLKATGHLGHKGGPVFAAPSDPECEAIIAWIQGKEAP